MKRVVASVIVTSATLVATARAQPVPDVPIPPDSPPAKTDPIPPDPKPQNPDIPKGETDDKPATPADPYQAKEPTVPKLKPLGPLTKYCSWTTAASRCMPEALSIPTGWLLPQAVLYSRTTLDTGGGVSSDTRVGLGDVAEFGVATTDSVRERQTDDKTERSERIQPYVTASFRLGVQESRLFDEQPGITLGFRKSFERHHKDFATRIAELTLVASKHIGPKIAVHVGGAFWDASLRGDLDADETTPQTETTLHDLETPKKQIRPFAGLEVRPLPRSLILVDIGWAPEFCYGCQAADQIRLKPILSWGVRYEVATWMRLEAGVRVPDIGDANLLDAQIFGQVTFTSSALRSAVESLK